MILTREQVLELEARIDPDDVLYREVFLVLRSHEALRCQLEDAKSVLKKMAEHKYRSDRGIYR